MSSFSLLCLTSGVRTDLYSRNGGSFGVLAASRGASRVVCLHPSLDIFNLGQLNIENNCLSSLQILFLQSDLSLFLQSFIRKRQGQKEEEERRREELYGYPSSSLRSEDIGVRGDNRRSSIDASTVASSSPSLLQREIDALSPSSPSRSSLPSSANFLSSSTRHSEPLLTSLPSRAQEILSPTSTEQNCRHLHVCRTDDDYEEEEEEDSESLGSAATTPSMRRRNFLSAEREESDVFSSRQADVRPSSEFPTLTSLSSPPGKRESREESIALLEQAEEAARKTLDFLHSSPIHHLRQNQRYVHHHGRQADRFRGSSFDVVVLDIPVDLFQSSSLSYFHVKTENLRLVGRLLKQALDVTAKGGVFFFSVSLPGLKRQDFHRLVQR